MFLVRLYDQNCEWMNVYWTKATWTVHWSATARDSLVL